MRKTSTRILSAILAVMMLVGLMPMSITSSAAFNDTSLKFDENGNFRVIQIADIQENTEVHETTLALIAKAMNRYEPDLVVFTGDNVESGMDESEFKTCVGQFMAPIISAGVRYAVTFGNHDAEDKSLVNTAWDKQSQYNYFVNMSSLSIDFDEPSLSGVGTGSIPIYSNDESRVAFCIFPIDSGEYDSNNDYDHVKTDQINWYASESERLATLNNGNKVPTLIFQHIPVPEIYDNLLVEVPEGTAGAVPGTGNWSNKFYTLDPNNPTITGEMLEGPCPAAINNGQYQGWLDAGNVVGAFFGHDHTNTFVGTDANGITMGYCKAATLEAYHAIDNDPGIRVFDIKEDGTYTTESVTYYGMQQEDAEDYEHDEISGTPTVPEVIYVGAADNSIAKQELGTTIQLQSLNHKTQAMYNNDLTVTIDLANDATNVTIKPTSGVNLSAVTVTTKDEQLKTYSWNITGGTASAGTTVEYKIEYDVAGVHYAQYAYSYVDNIKTPAGHYVYTRNYRGNNTSANWNTQCYLLTVLGPTVYGHARTTTDIELLDTYEGDTNVGSWTNAPAGYYNYSSSEDGGFVQMDTRYGINFMSPSRVRVHNTFPRFTQAGKSPVATVYADTAEHETLTSVGVFFNFWRHQTPTNNVTTTFTTAIKQGDVGYSASNWSSGVVASNIAATQSANVTLAAARTSNITNNLTGNTVPANGTQLTAITQGYSYIDTNYETHHYTYTPVLLNFVTYNKTELRALLNAERTANRQLEDNMAYRSAFKEAFKQIQKPNTTQADIDNAVTLLTAAVEALSFTGSDVSNNGEYYMNATVPSKLYVAGTGYGLSAQPKGTTIQPQIVNYRTRAMIDYTNFQVTLPNGATNALVNVYNKTTGAAVTYTWDAATASGKVTGGTANSGDVIVYEFTYELAGKSYTQIEASTVEDAPQASGWLTYIRRDNWANTNQTSQESVIYFVPVGVPAEGIQYVGHQGTAGYDNAYYGVNLTNFNGDNSQKVSGYGINSWTGPSKQTKGAWFCGSDGKEDMDDGNFARAKFSLYFDTSLPVTITKANVMLTGIGLRTQGDSAQIVQASEEYFDGQGQYPNFGTSVGNINGPSYDDAGNDISASVTFNDTQGDLFYKYMISDSAPAGNYTYYTHMTSKNGSKSAIGCHYAWHINIIATDKTVLRNLVAQENEVFRQLSDGYSDANGKWTNYVNALAAAKGAVQDATLTASENDAAATALQTAIAELEYMPADYTALRAKVDEIRRQMGTDPETGAAIYEYRPHPEVDPLYYSREEYYPWYYFRSTNETDIPINSINWNLDIRYQAEVDTYLELVIIGWESAQLSDADYEEVDKLLAYKTGTNPNGSYGGLTITLPDIDKYAVFADLENRELEWENYTTESYNNWANACAPAMTNRSLKSPDQTVVDGYADALLTAYNNLQLKTADYTALDAKIAEATSNIDAKVDVVDPSNSANNYQITYYDADYLAQLRAKCEEKVEGLYILQQEEVDLLEHEIDLLYVALGNHLNDADFTFANEQKAITVTYEQSPTVYYTEASWNRLVAARAAVDEAANYGYMSGEQVTVNALAQEVYDARNALTYNTADYSKVNGWLAKIAELEPTKTDYANWADVEAAIAQVEENLDITYQAAVDTMATNLETAYNNLKLKDADYSKLNNQITAAQALMSNQALYTPGSYSNFLAVYNEALAFYMAEPKVDIQHQDTVDAMEAKLVAAMEQLEYVDATIAPLEDAVSYYMSVDYYAYEAEYPTDTDGDGIVDVYEEADAQYQAAQALLDQYNAGELDIRHNEQIQAQADALNAAVNNLPALYADLDWEISQIPEDYYTTPQKYTAASRQKLANALAAIDRNLKIGDQEKVYEYIDAVVAAVAELEEADADLTALNAAITAADEKIAGQNTANYTDVTWAAFQTAYAAAQAVRDADPAYKYSQQADVDTATSNLVAATNNLKKKGADYTALDAAIDRAEALNKDDWTDDSWAEVVAAFATANNLGRDLTIEDQPTIDAAAEALDKAIDELESAKIPCNYAALDAAIAAAATADTTNCTSASIAEFNAALEAANAIARDLIIDDAGANQAAIDAAATRLQNAITGLTPLGECNYAVLDAAIAAYEAKVADKALYANWAEYETAYNVAKAVARDMIADEAGANQATIDNAAAALNAVVLVYKDADYSAVEAAKATIPADLSIYTSASVKAVNDAVAAVVYGYNITKQAEVDAFAAAITDAVAKLAPLGNCDYTALDAAIAAYEAKVADKALYANWTEYETAYNVAKAIARDMLDDEAGANQATIDNAATALNSVVLVYRDADYSAVEAAKATIPADLSIYTSASVKAVNDAVAAVVYDLDITKQAEVDAYAAAINDAVAKLVPLGNCDYSELDQFIADYEAALPNKDEYTDASWAEYEAAYEAAKEIARDMLDDEAGASQAAIDSAAAALKGAAEEIKIKEYCKYDYLEEILMYCSELDADEAYYDATELAEWKAALATAQALLADKDSNPLELTAENQAILDNAAAALAKEYDDLIEMYVDTSALEAAIADCSDIEYEIERYTATSWAAYEAALEAAQAAIFDYTYAPDTQANRDALAALKAELEKAYAELEVISYADYSELEEILEYCSELDADEAYYDATELAEWKAALAAAQALIDDRDNGIPLENTADNQAIIDNAAAALAAEYDDLIEMYVDTSALEAAIADCSDIEYEIERYTATSWAAYEAAYEAAQAAIFDYTYAPDTQANRDALAALKAELEKAYAELEVISYADYSELEEILGYCSELDAADEYYDAAELAEYKAALAAAQALIDDRDSGVPLVGTADNQAIIDDAAAALAKEYDDLYEIYVDTSDLAAAVENCSDIPYAIESYTDASWAAYEAALEAAEAALVDYDCAPDTAAIRDILAGLKADLEKAYAELTLKGADYTALEAAIDRADALNADDWTDETWADVVTALEAANNVAKDLTVEDQTTIDMAAEALNEAIDKLEEAAVPVVLKAKAGSTTVIDRERGFIYGLDCAGVNAFSEYEFVTDLLAQNFVEIEGDGSLRYTYVGNNTVLGTGAKVELIDNKTGEVLEVFYIVIFGDNDGDGTVTPNDAVDMNDYMAWNECVHDYGDFTDPAVFAMDLDNDGEITANDFVVCADYIAWNCDVIPQTR